MKLRLFTFSLMLLATVQGALATVHNITASGTSFTPSTLTITQGDTVVWTNTSGSHNLNGTTTTFPSNPASFGMSTTGTGWTYQHTFTVAGSYSYQCDPHAPGMSGTITVNAAAVPAVPCSQPFFSEYIEGSSNNKGFEVYNPTNGALNLGPYKVVLSVNGGSSVSQFNLTGTLASGDVYVITTDQADPVMLAQADTALSFPSVAHYNGDDALFLVDTVNNDTLDIIGVIGVDPGSNWTVGTGATADYTLVRNSTVDYGQKDWTVGVTEWTVHPQNTYTFFGAHSSTCVSAPALPCTKPFFSEYIEGSSNNKGFEIYNPSSTSLDLAPYKAIMSSNGGTSTTELNLQGIVAANDVYVVTTNQSDPIMIAAADTTFPFPSVAHFNGDDALFLLDTVTNDTVDIIGVVGVDPGSSWTVGTGTTADHTLVRKNTVDMGQKDWTIGATEWDVHPQNTYTFLGAHSNTCSGTPLTPTVDFASANVTVSEDAGTVTVNVLMSPAATTAETIDLQFVLGANITIPADGSVSPLPNITTGILQLTVPANEDTVSFDVSIVDDAVIEGNETLFVSLSAVSSGLTMGTTTSMTFVVEDNDYRTADIASITSVDANLEPDSLGGTFITYGVVYTDDFDGNAGLSFYIYDNTGGINVFNFDDVSNYTVTRGDSIMVIGTIAQYRGLTEIEVDSINVLATGIALKQPAVVSVLDETTEGEFIKLENWEFADTTQWNPGSGTGFNVDITNGIDTFIMRVDNDIDLFNMPLPTTGKFHVMGAGSQFTFNTNPAEGGYQIFPRDRADIITKFSLEEAAALEVSLYPNPVSDVLYIERTSNAEAIVKITNGAGAVVSYTRTTDSLIEVSTSHLASGVYMVSIESEGAKAIRKIIVN